jgi:hypothetical protein
VAGGYRLTRFRIESEVAFGAERRFEVVLSLSDPKGQTVQQKATYNVGTGALLSVTREEGT